jgi:MarR family transcriptional regulator, organic hydroperoxide resistance regulator
MPRRNAERTPWAPSSEQIGEELSHVFSEIVLRRIARIETVSSEIGLSELQARTLFHIDPKQPVPMSEVARRAGYEPSNLTGVVDKLEARGLVRRRSATDDRRVKRVSLTREGAALRKRLILRLYAPEPWMLALSADDQRKLRDILRKGLAFQQAAGGE